MNRASYETCLKARSMLDWDLATVLNVKIDSADGRNDDEWDLMPRCKDSGIVSPDLVGGVTVFGYPVRTNDDCMNIAVLK
jgi:hypothetical protein